MCTASIHASIHIVQRLIILFWFGWGFS
jgi:hypothetical protein